MRRSATSKLYAIAPHELAFIYDSTCRRRRRVVVLRDLRHIFLLHRSTTASQALPQLDETGVALFDVLIASRQPLKIYERKIHPYDSFHSQTLYMLHTVVDF